ncbi:MAG: dephospho-CoA kinase [Gammaproteobacteria bacterium]|nr:dephospho-CoA kinase [Gammaproteobacteria bacterium]NIR84234.1 dephospho-CoA kinase [Gammaproteobacteria bacterium]NIR89704.1 dephospho-CoA kinase [Gammaproteobacteria bacterium]NIU05392.1 dephospho-CoA kinase [Gammaproteobacteria bacterium]NIV52338.1 dephospho-CoA kinase [Gammaproteobacteria bacterium]
MSAHHNHAIDSRRNRPRLVVGLTGGIGSGKSSVAGQFARLGVSVIDADVVARDVVAPGQPALSDIADAFGHDLLTPEGALDRRCLRERVFREPRMRRRLEAILHPRIRDGMLRKLQTVDAPYCVLCIPLLLETEQRDLVDRVLVVDAPPELQVERTRARDGSSRETVEHIMQAQLGREERLAAADDVIENDGTLEQLRARVKALHERYLDMAESGLPPHLPPKNNS